MEYESLKSKLQKLQALVDRGEAGEAENAQRAIERLCSEYGINLDEVLDFASKRKYTFEVGRAKDMLQLFMRCLSAYAMSFRCSLQYRGPNLLQTHKVFDTDK